VTEAWQVVAGVAGGLVLAWVVLIAAMALAARGRSGNLSLVAALRLGPDVLRLVWRLVGDSSVSWWVRALMAALGLYLLSPIDLVPDFIPVIGYLDDAIVVVLVLRLTLSRAGPDALARHWPGTPDGLAALRTLTGTRASV
jgi:uncharacterized membrane protein YkvA (DUF1232 family)